MTAVPFLENDGVISGLDNNFSPPTLSLGMTCMDRMKQAILLSPLVLALAACASSATTREAMESWNGSSLRELTDAWGNPDKVRTFEGKRYYTWAWRGKQGVANVPDMGTTATPGMRTGYHTEQTAAYCDRIAQVNDAGRVEHLTWDGNACGQFAKSR